MAVELEKLIVELSANTRGLDREMKRTRTDFQKRLDEMEKRTSQFAGRVGKAADKAGKSFSGIFGAGIRSGLGFAAAQAGLNGVEGALRRIGQVADLGDLSEKIGFSTTAIQALQFQALETGGSVEGLNSGLIRFTANLADAGTKSGELYKIFKANDVAIRDSNGALLSGEEALKRFADIVANARNPSEALEFAVRAFGRAAGPELVGLLSQGSGGIDNFARKAEDVGAIVDEEMIKKFQELDDKIKQLGFAINSNLVKGITNFGSIMGKILDQIEEAGRRLGAPEFAQRAGQIINAQGPYRRAPGSISGSPVYSSRVDQRLDPQYGVATMGGDVFNDVFAAGYPRAVTTRVDPDRATTFAAPTPRRTGTSILPGSGSGSGTGKSDAEEEADAYKRLLDSTRQRIEDLRIEQATLGMSEGAAAAYRTEQELLNDATRDGIALSPTQRAEIAALAAQMGTATTVVESHRAAQEALKDQIEELKGAFTDVGRGIYDGFRQSASGIDIATDALDRLASRAFDRGLNTLADMLFSNTGVIAGLLGGGGIPTMAQGGFGPDIPGRAIGGPVSAGRPYMVGESGPEMFLPRTAGTIVPNARLAGGGGGVINIDARGAQMGVAEQIVSALRQYDQTVDAKFQRNNRMLPGYLRQTELRR